MGLHVKPSIASIYISLNSDINSDIYKYMGAMEGYTCLHAAPCRSFRFIHSEIGLASHLVQGKYRSQCKLDLKKGESINTDLKLTTVSTGGSS